MSGNMIIPSDPIDYLLLDRFNRGTALEVHGTAPGWMKNPGALYDSQSGVPGGEWSSNDDGTGLSNFSNQPGAQDLLSIDIGEAYTHVYVDALVGAGEALSVFFHTTEDLRNDATHNSYQLRLLTTTGFYGSQGRVTVLGSNTNGTIDDGTNDGDGTGDEIPTVIAENTRVRALFTFKDDRYTVKIGDHERSWPYNASVPKSTALGLSFTTNLITCHIYDLRVW